MRVPRHLAWKGFHVEDSRGFALVLLGTMLAACCRVQSKPCFCNISVCILCESSHSTTVPVFILVKSEMPDLRR